MWWEFQISSKCCTTSKLHTTRVLRSTIYIHSTYKLKPYVHSMPGLMPSGCQLHCLGQQFHPGCGIWSSVSKGWDVPLSRHKEIILFQCPFARDKGRSKNPGTNSSVPGQDEFLIIRKNDQISCFRTSFSCCRTSFSCFRTSFSCFRTYFSALSCFVLRDGMGHAVKI